MCTKLDFTNREPKGNAMKLFRMVIENKIDPCIVLLGQDPYPQPGVATGIAFANNKQPYSPSLLVLRDSVVVSPNSNFDYTLESWVKQGILPINVAFTVQTNKPGSDLFFWAGFTAEFLRDLDKEYPKVSYIFFGNNAQSFSPCITNGTFFFEMHPAYYARNHATMSNHVWHQVFITTRAKFGKEIKLTDK